MLIADTEIATPLDKAYAYNMDWRYKVASVLEDRREIHRLMADEWVYAQIQYLGLVDDEEFNDCLEDAVCARHVVGNQLRDVAEANSIYQSGPGDHTHERLEALLLCPELSYKVIAHEFNINENVVRMFEKIFFNVRDDEGRLYGYSGLLMYAALKGARKYDSTRPAEESDPALWRIISFEGGYKPLYSLWAWQFKGDLAGFTGPDIMVDMMRNLYRQMDKFLRSDHVDSRALAQMLTTLMQQFADMRKEGILSDKDVIDPNMMMLEFIKLLAPERIVETAETLKLAQDDLDGKLQAVMSREGRGGKDDKPKAFRQIEAHINKGAVKDV